MTMSDSAIPFDFVRSATGTWHLEDPARTRGVSLCGQPQYNSDHDEWSRHSHTTITEQQLVDEHCCQRCLKAARDRFDVRRDRSPFYASVPSPDEVVTVATIGKNGMTTINVPPEKVDDMRREGYHTIYEWGMAMTVVRQLEKMSGWLYFLLPDRVTRPAEEVHLP